MPNFRACKRKGCTKVVDYWSRKFFCSNACKMQDYRARTTKHYHVRENPYPKHCRTCGKKFNALNPNAVYCTGACKQRFYREQIQLNNGIPRQLEIPESAYTISNSIT